MGLFDFIKRKKPTETQAVIEEKSNVEYLEEDAKRILEEATKRFFPETGRWMSNCFEKSKELDMGNLPCNLRNYKWLAAMFKKEQGLDISDKQVLLFVQTSPFKEQRHAHELRIVDW